MTTLAITHPASTEFVAYEYTTVRAPRDLARLYEDTYRSFGWTVTDEQTVPGAVEFKLKRDRSIRTRSAIAELERKAQRSLTNIGRLNSSPRTFAMTTAITHRSDRHRVPRRLRVHPRRLHRRIRRARRGRPSRLGGRRCFLHPRSQPPRREARGAHRRGVPHRLRVQRAGHPPPRIVQLVHLDPRARTPLRWRI